ncbi:MAG: sigma-70 family RNA polymerase sigma factor [Oscillospiraceae bacterium]|nr:sigma-70 family RNA polymerase sigma factor [Oscillospiraceae bacterium]
MLSIYAALIDEDEDLRFFEHIYWDYGSQMLSVALSILKDPPEAEDAVQNALLGIARSIKSVPRKNQRVLRAYVLTAARNAACALLPEKKQRDKQIGIDNLRIPNQEELFETILRSQEYELLLRIINTLPIQYREVLMLRYVVGLKPREIAKVLGRRTATVQQQLTRGKSKVVELYRKEVALDE